MIWAGASPPKDDSPPWKSVQEICNGATTSDWMKLRGSKWSHSKALEPLIMKKIGFSGDHPPTGSKDRKRFRLE